MRVAFQASQEAARIVAVLREMSIGQDMSFAELSARSGFAVTSKTSSYQRARRNALRDHGVITDAIPGFGIRRLSGAETLGKADKHLSSIGRKARHASREVGFAMRSNLTPDEMVDATRKQGALGVILMNSQSVQTPKAPPPPPPPAPAVPRIP